MIENFEIHILSFLILNFFESSNIMSDARPILGITMGDPAGIGPEILAKALRSANRW